MLQAERARKLGRAVHFEREDQTESRLGCFGTEQHEWQRSAAATGARFAVADNGNGQPGGAGFEFDPSKVFHECFYQIPTKFSSTTTQFNYSSFTIISFVIKRSFPHAQRWNANLL
jgi:hypothetical protein